MEKTGWFGVVRVTYKVIGNATIRWLAYNFLFVFNRNHACTLYRFRDTASDLKFPNFDLLHLHLVPPLVVTRLNFDNIFDNRKLGDPWAIMRRYLRYPTFSRFNIGLTPTCDGQTDIHGHGHRHTAMT